MSDGIRWKLWNTKPRLLLRKRARAVSEREAQSVSVIRTVPEVGLSSRPMMLSSVDLPQPEGPMMLRNSPFSTLRFTFSRAVVSISRVRNTLPILFSSIIAIAVNVLW